MLRCLSPREGRYRRGEFLLLAGEPVREMGLILSGEAILFTEDYWGNRNILSSLQRGDLFAEVFACTPGTRSIPWAMTSAIFLVFPVLE